ncbi:ubiquitin carboxyl-terminal hydrolase [Puccinia sorghi]|uniref:Ubiquitin carboxyl-terminal hydrolase n=1 Tax=Puccinia sorghi TaxID=27349 RepID=A0A0L6V318_9BASI|nr:ubiquitin carboxyl-terminal hydrolase [Puccinia sorghi]
MGGTGRDCQCPIDLLFRCELRSLVVCGNCGVRSSTVDPLLDLSLEIAHLTHLPILRLKDCLDSFTRPERLLHKCYTCSNCHVASPDTTKALTIERLPHILCFQLKRFEHHGSASVKLDKHVQFPLLLDMKPYVASDTTNQTDDDTGGLYYRLTGIVRHQGNVTSGHYQAIIWQDDQWFCFNDDTVSLITLNHLRQIEAYLLVYSFIPNPLF